MYTHASQELVVLLIIWLFFIVICEALNELVRNATPLEGIRAFFTRRSTFLSQLLSCGYCTSVWVGLSIGWILPPVLPEYESFGSRYLIIASFLNTYLWWLINGIILHRASNFLHDFVNKRHVFQIQASTIRTDDEGNITEEADKLIVNIEGK